MSRMRSKIAHHYEGILRQIVWNTWTTSLPELRRQVVGLLHERR